MKLMAETEVIQGNNVSISLYVFLPVLILIFSLLKFVYHNSRKSSQLPPGPYPWPILGNILSVGNKPHVNLAHLSKIYGPLISLRLGTQLLIVASSNETAIEILRTHDRILSARKIPHVLSLKSELYNSSLGWSPECGERWKYLRTICRMELFSAKAIESQASRREKKAMEMVEFLKEMENKVVEVGEVIFATVYNTLSNVLLSRDFISTRDDDKGEHDGMKKVIRTFMELASTPNISDLYPLLSGLDLQGLSKKFQDLSFRMTKMWAYMIKERRERHGCGVSEKKDFLDVMIENDFTNDQINQLLLELFSAGTDTSSSTIVWAMAELLKNPESMIKVREELAREVEQFGIKEKQLNCLPYLQACVKETLRLHPPAPLLLPHRAAETCKVMNYTIPRNSQVLVNVWAIGRDATYWEDPLVFKPERFLGSSVDYKGTDFEYLPFGAGRRICPGLNMASKQVPLLLANLVHFFDWDLPNGMSYKDLDMSEKFGVTLEKEQPLILIPKIRKEVDFQSRYL